MTSGNAASYSLELVPVSGSAGNVSLSCSNVPPNSTCTVTPATTSLLNASNIQVAIATGVGSPVGSSIERYRGGMAGSLPWPIGFLLFLLPLRSIRNRSKTLLPGLYRLLAILVLIVTMAGMMACGKGGGLLGAGSNPLPGTSLTPSGTYVVTVTAVAGGLQKSVGLTVQVQ